MASVAERTVLSLKMRRPRLGAWHVDSELDSSDDISGRVSVEIDGVVWSGTVMDSHVHAGRCTVWIVGGAGGMLNEREAGQYVDAKLGDIVMDLLAFGKEALSDTVSKSILSRKVGQWERMSGPVSHSLVRLLDEQGLAWRVLQDGTIWIGEDAWGAVTTDAIVLDEDWSDGAILLGPKAGFGDLSPISPGSTFGGHRIQHVTHTIDQNAMRCIASTRSVGSELDRFLEPVLQRIDYASPWLCEVKVQNQDGTLQVAPVDKRLQGKGLNKVPIRVGVPGFELKVKSGAAVILEFDGGDPSKPFVSGWKHGEDNVTSVEFKPGGTGVPLCKVGDTLEIVLPMGLPVTTSLGPAIVTFSTPAQGIITGPGNSKLLV